MGSLPYISCVVVRVRTCKRPPATLTEPTVEVALEGERTSWLWRAERGLSILEVIQLANLNTVKSISVIFLNITQN